MDNESLVPSEHTMFKAMDPVKVEVKVEGMEDEEEEAGGFDLLLSEGLREPNPCVELPHSIFTTDFPANFPADFPANFSEADYTVRPSQRLHTNHFTPSQKVS